MNKSFSILKYIYLLLPLLMAACSNHSISKQKVIVIQPFSDFSEARAKDVYAKLKQINPNTFLATPVPLPANAFYPKRNRYRADSLLKFLDRHSDDTVVVGITSFDISTTKDQYADWGVMGLGYSPGDACVVSTFRLKKKNTDDQFYKVVIHELGHTAGLPHCKSQTCFMRDAEGGNPLDKEKDFCPSCKSFLRKKGWMLK